MTAPDVTRPMDMTHDAFREYALTRLTIGGSDIGALLGLNKWRTPLDVWRDKMGLREPTPVSNDMRRGIVLEPIAAEEYERVTGHSTYSQRWVKDAEHSFLLGKPDRLIRNPGHRASDGVLEIKCVRERGLQQCRTDGIDPSYAAQLHWYMGLSGLHWGAFAVFSAESWETHAFEVEFDAVWYREARQVAINFFNTYVLTRTSPAPQSRAELLESYRPLPTTGAELVRREDRAWVAAAVELAVARGELALAEEREKRAREAVQALMVEAGQDGVVGGGLKVTWRESSRTSLDTEALKAAHPELDLTRYQKRTVSRTFRVTPQ